MIFFLSEEFPQLPNCFSKSMNVKGIVLLVWPKSSFGFFSVRCYRKPKRPFWPRQYKDKFLLGAFIVYSLWFIQWVPQLT